MNTPVSGLHHIALRTPDVDRTVAFYEALGYTRVHGWSLPQIDLRRAVMIQSPDAASWIEIFDDRDFPVPSQCCDELRWAGWHNHSPDLNRLPGDKANPGTMTLGWYERP